MKLDVLKILDDLGIPYANGGSQNVVIRCVNPHHIEKKPSMYIHKETGLINCFGCHTKGHILQLVQNTLNINKFELVKYLEKYTKGGVTESEVTNALMENFRKRLETSMGVMPAVQATVPEYIPEHRDITANLYLEKVRGFTLEEIIYWKMAECTVAPYKGWIYIPIYMNELYRGYFLRSTYDSRKLYGKHPRRDILFGFDSANDFDKPLYICEGIFDMIYLRRMGVQSVAILANIITDEQLTILKKYKKIVLVPDMDANLRGMHLVHSALPLLYSSLVTVMVLPRKDPAESTLEELFTADLHTIPINQYVFSERYQNFMQMLEKQKVNKSEKIFRR